MLQVFLSLIIFEDMEWIEAGFVFRHADQHVFLLLLRLLRGVEEGVENAFEGLHFVDGTTLFLHVLFHRSLEVLL